MFRRVNDCIAVAGRSLPALLKTALNTVLITALFTALALPGHAATFGLGTLIQVALSSSSTNGATIGAGDNGSASTVSANAASFQDGQGRWVAILYQQPTNTLQIRLYDGATNGSAYTSINYNPAGGPPAANVMWTIPAAAFFVSATTGVNRPTSISFSNLTLTGISGALNIISPMSQTSLTASKAGGPASPGQTTIQGGDIMFQGDSTGSWMLSGLLTLTGVNGNGASGNELALGFSGTASAVPETSSLSLMGIGLAALIVGGRGRRGKTFLLNCVRRSSNTRSPHVEAIDRT
jgi:hypothetical protein